MEQDALLFGYHGHFYFFVTFLGPFFGPVDPSDAPVGLDFFRLRTAPLPSLSARPFFHALPSDRSIFESRIFLSLLLSLPSFFFLSLSLTPLSSARLASLAAFLSAWL